TREAVSAAPLATARRRATNLDLAGTMGSSFEVHGTCRWAQGEACRHDPIRGWIAGRRRVAFLFALP
ncbi:MAG: hypothetical protein ACRDGL_02895, partial [Candidatus Limnocylindrales bacterium]